VTKTVLPAREYGRAPQAIVRALGFTSDDYLRAVFPEGAVGRRDVGGR
jgi:hypothetical protein